MRVEWWWAQSQATGWESPESSGVQRDAPYFTAEFDRGMVGVPATRQRVPGRYLVSGSVILTGAFWIVVGFGSGGPLAGLMGLALLVLGAGLLSRVHALSHAEPSFWVDAEGVISDGVTVPWTSIRSVERTSITGPARSRRWFRLRGPAVDINTWDLLALEIVEFDGVRGLRPVVVGLANLQRRRRIVLAAASELYDPEAVAMAIDLLLQRPEDRWIMGTPRAEELFLTGGHHLP